MRYTWGKGDVVLAEEQPIARADRSWFRERAEVTIGDTDWVFRAEGRDRVGESQGQVRIRTCRPRTRCSCSGWPTCSRPARTRPRRVR